MERAPHWNRVYTTKTEQEVSWFEPLPAISLEMLEAAGMTPDSCVLEVGGGDSHLVDALAARGPRPRVSRGARRVGGRSRPGQDPSGRRRADPDLD